MFAAIAMTVALGVASPGHAAEAGDDAVLQASPMPPSGLLRSVRDRAADLVVTSFAFVGVPYRRGGESGGGFDCSGFTRHIFEASLGLMLPRKVDQQAGAKGLQPVQRAELQPGDLVFFNTLRRTFSHVGIYIGDGKFIHAPKPGAEVRIEDMRYRYWARRFTGARRAVAALADADAPPANP